MRDLKLIHGVEEAGALLQPLRLQVLVQLDAPRSCAEIAEALRESPQKIHYHVKVLERAGLVEKVAERRVRALAEALYRATARSFWLSPKLVDRIGGPRRARDAASLEHLLGLAEELPLHLSVLAQHVAEGHEIPSLGLTADVDLADRSRRAAFLRDVEESIRAIATRYARNGSTPSGGAREGYRLLLACYPHPDTELARTTPEGRDSR
jgi:DNA-binding transcriptional ArsR family regulator